LAGLIILLKHRWTEAKPGVREGGKPGADDDELHWHAIDSVHLHGNSFLALADRRRQQSVDLLRRNIQQRGLGESANSGVAGPDPHADAVEDGGEGQAIGSRLSGSQIPAENRKKASTGNAGPHSAAVVGRADHAITADSGHQARLRRQTGGKQQCQHRGPHASHLGHLLRKICRQYTRSAGRLTLPDKPGWASTRTQKSSDNVKLEAPVV
jgi:hypothetical protein